MGVGQLVTYFESKFSFLENTIWFLGKNNFVLINVFTLRAKCLLSTLLVLTLIMHELGHWSSIAGLSPQSHYGDEEDWHTGLSS